MAKLESDIAESILDPPSSEAAGEDTKELKRTDSKKIRKEKEKSKKKKLDRANTEEENQVDSIVSSEETPDTG